MNRRSVAVATGIGEAALAVVALGLFASVFSVPLTVGVPVVLTVGTALALTWGRRTTAGRSDAPTV